MLIEYCDKCGSRIADSEPHSKVMDGSREVVICEKCMPVQQNARATPQGIPGRPKTATKIPRPSAPAQTQRHAEKPAQGSPVIVLAIGGGLLAVGLIFILMKRKPDDSPALKNDKPVNDNVATVKESPAGKDAAKPPPDDKGADKPRSLFGMNAPGKDDDVLSGARSRIAGNMLNAAKQMRAKNTHDSPAYRDMLNNIVSKYRDTPEGAEAAKLLEAVKIPTLVEDPNDKRKRTDLLKLVDPARDKVHGNWKMEGGNLGSDNMGLSRCKLPWTPPEEYDLRVKFVRQDGRSDVAIFLMHRGQCGMLMIAGYENTCSGFDKVADKRPKDNPTGVTDSLENKREYAVVVQVRRDGIRAFRDGVLMCEYRNELGNLTLNQDWNMAPCVGVGSHDSPTTFTSIVAVHE